ncbi:Myb-like DNA-binding domain-containing protein [Marininema mesophilum]|uniref:Myb-like DNA-binding domain-containing protein n=1 Tax=Marininema mesophilum TaxID=1048340 RepID=A0A1H3C9R4_9BACL|nr:hypothetical protein [Marininema mesophilum]SDX50861.1 Myb-like DNA-binding domain-containing protein [Marininema mesophilum]
MSRSWNEEDDQMLCYWVSACRRSGMSRNRTFTTVAQKMGRDEEECFLRWKDFSVGETNPSSYLNKWAGLNSEPLSMLERVQRLEDRIQASQVHIEQLLKENRKLREEMKFFEMLLLEEYQLLVKLLDRKKPKAKIHGF